MKTIGKAADWSGSRYIGKWPIAKYGGVIGSPTGGAKGAGTLNAEAIYINNVAVSAGGNTGTINVFNAQNFL